MHEVHACVVWFRVWILCGLGRLVGSTWIQLGSTSRGIAARVVCVARFVRDGSGGSGGSVSPWPSGWALRVDVTWHAGSTRTAGLAALLPTCRKRRSIAPGNRRAGAVVGCHLDLLAYHCWKSDRAHSICHARSCPMTRHQPVGIARIGAGLLHCDRKALPSHGVISDNEGTWEQCKRLCGVD